MAAHCLKHRTLLSLEHANLLRKMYLFSTIESKNTMREHPKISEQKYKKTSHSEIQFAVSLDISIQSSKIVGAPFTKLPELKEMPEFNFLKNIISSLARGIDSLTTSYKNYRTNEKLL